MSASGAALGRLAAHRGQGMDDRIEHRHGVDLALAAFALELAPDRRVDDRVKDQARAFLDIVEDPVEMALGSDHRPNVAQCLDRVELGKAGARHHLQRLAGRV